MCAPLLVSYLHQLVIVSEKSTEPCTCCRCSGMQCFVKGGVGRMRTLYQRTWMILFGSIMQIMSKHGRRFWNGKLFMLGNVVIQNWRALEAVQKITRPVHGSGTGWGKLIMFLLGLLFSFSSVHDITSEGKATLRISELLLFICSLILTLKIC